MDVKASEIKAGIIILAGLGLLVFFLILIFGVDFGKVTKQYTTTLGYVGGIEVGSLVKYGGMNVGAVQKVDFADDDPTNIMLLLQVDGKTPVKIDSKAFVTSIGIMADQHIEISTGSPDAALLPPDSEIESKAVLSFTQMAEPLGELSGKTQELLDQVIKLFDKENRGHIASMLASMDKMMTDGGDQFVQMTENMEKLTGNLQEISADLNDLMEKNKETFDLTLSHLETTAKETSQLISDMRASFQEIEGMVSANSTSLVEIMENFQYTSQNLEEFSRIVKERPWLLVRKAAPPERKIN